jgi:hypothetical protein
LHKKYSSDANGSLDPTRVTIMTEPDTDLPVMRTDRVRFTETDL